MGCGDCGYREDRDSRLPRREEGCETEEDVGRRGVIRGVESGESHKGGGGGVGVTGGGAGEGGGSGGGARVLRVFLGILVVSSCSLRHVNAQDSRRTQRNLNDLDDIFPEITASPYFMSPGHRNITTMVGQTAYLHCRVAQLGDLAQVSWMRKRDLRVLSSGMVVFASDQRFQVLHSEKSENWTLQIKYAQLRDSGIYECQVNTVPKISMAYTLNVVEMRATIVGPEYVKSGSTISLTCQINQANLPGLVYWYHNNKMLDYEGQVKITTKEGLHGTSSHLTISKATPQHSGNYTC